MPAGRKTKRTPEMEAKLCEYLRSGNTRKTAYNLAGIGHTAFDLWMQIPAFAAMVTRAEDEALATAVAVIKRASVGVKSVRTVTKRVRVGDVENVEVTTTEETEYDWRAAAWWLERKHPKDWRERKTIDIDKIPNDRLLELIELEEQEAGGAEG